jgi:hypothetical protein
MLLLCLFCCSCDCLCSNQQPAATSSSNQQPAGCKNKNNKYFVNKQPAATSSQQAANKQQLTAPSQAATMEFDKLQRDRLGNRTAMALEAKEVLTEDMFAIAHLGNFNSDRLQQRTFALQRQLN